MYSYCRGFLVLLLLAGICGCATTHATSGSANIPGCHVTNHRRVPASIPKKISIVPVKVSISELSAGGAAEEVPQWSEAGKKIVKQCLYEHCKTYLNLEIVPFVTLSDEDVKLLDQYRTLYETVAGNQHYIERISAWGHLHGRAVTLGRGLSALREKLGVDSLLFVSGYDYHSTAGRKTTAVIYAALAGVVMPMGHCSLHSGLVELETGDVLWSNTVGSGRHSLKNEQHVRELITKSFAAFPTASRSPAADPKGDKDEPME